MNEDLIWQCPVCAAPLHQESRQLSCATGHTYDLAREGYVNLLLAHHRKSSASGDSAAAARARRSFLARGSYEGLSDKLNEVLASELSRRPAGDRCVLDVGCGEGYYLRRYAERTRGGSAAVRRRYGIDISKPAIRLAARADASARYAVAGSRRLPVQSGTVDVVSCVFAPSDVGEMLRVLGPAGLLLTVTPGPDHLRTLRRVLYETPQSHPLEWPAPDGFRSVGEWRVEYEFDLPDPGAIGDLVAMTPYRWRGDARRRDRLLAMDTLDVEADFLVGLYASHGG